MKRLAMLYLLSCLLVVMTINNNLQNKPAKASTLPHISTKGFYQGVDATPTSTPRFILSYPLADPMQYGSYVDHYNPNGFYPIPTDGIVEPYTGEIANKNYLAPGCAYTAPGRSDPYPTPVIAATPQGRGYYCYEGHSALDLNADEGTSVYAASRGRVVAMSTIAPLPTPRPRGYGNRVIVQDSTNGSFTLYAHLSTPEVAVGAYVSRGQEIGKSGWTGLATPSDAHLHFGLYASTYPPGADYAPNVLDPYGWYGSGTDPLGSSYPQYKWASGYAPTNVTTDPINWNEGTLIGNTYKDKNRIAGTAHAVGVGVHADTNNEIDTWWSDNYGSAGVPLSDVTAGSGGYYYQDFEGGRYTTNFAGSHSYTPYDPGSGAFNDTPITYWAQRYIGWLRRENITHGYVGSQCTAHGVASPCYLPDQPIRRDEFAHMLRAGFGLPTHIPDTSTYCDVQPFPSDPYYNIFYVDIESLYNLNIMKGEVGAYCNDPGDSRPIFSSHTQHQQTRSKPRYY